MNIKDIRRVGIIGGGTWRLNVRPIVTAPRL